MLTTVHTHDVVLPDPAEVVEQIDTRQRRRNGVREAMRSLTVTERDIAVQVFIHDRPVSSVAAELELDPDTVAAAAQQAQQLLVAACQGL